LAADYDPHLADLVGHISLYLRDVFTSTAALSEIEM